MSILSQIIAYAPNKIDTEKKARALAIGPRAMVGEITDEQTQFGRPIYKTPSGEKVSEKSTTLFLNGNWMNVPSIHGGKSFNEDELRLMIKQGNLKPTSVHKSKDDAEAAAKARSDSMVQGSRIMKLAQVPRSEMDNFNTPDLEQAPDSYLRPGETLEDFDVEFRRPNAQGGRIPFAKAKSVQKIVGTNQSGTPEGAQERLKLFVDNFLKKNKRLPGKQEIRELGNFDFYTIKKGINSGKIEVLENLNTISQLKIPNEQILKLSKSKIINDIFKTGKTSIKDINKVKKVIGNVSDSVASTRILQLANIYSGSGAEDFRNLNIKSKFKKNAAKILSDSPYTGYIRNVNEALIGKSVGEPSIKGTKSKIVQDADYIQSGIAKAYDIDEPLGVASSVNRASTPYGIYGQIIDKSKNKLKVGWDARKSQLELELQEAIQSKDKKLIDEAVKKFNKEVKAAEKLFNKDIKKGQKKIVIPEISLDKPSKTIANYKNLSNDYKKAFDAVHSSQGYSFKISEDLKPIPEIKKNLKDSKILSEVKKSADLGAGRIYSNPFFDPSLMGKVISDIGKGINVGLGPTGMIALTKYLEPEGGYDLSKTGDRLGFEAEAALAKPLVSGAVSVTDKIKNPMLRKIAERAALAGMSPTMAMKVASRLSPLGIASLAGEAVYKIGKLGYEDQQRFNALSPEEQAAERAEQEKFAFDVEGS